MPIKSPSLFCARHRAFAALLALALAFTTPVSARWRIYETAKENGHRLTELDAIREQGSPGDLPVIRCDPSQTFQKMDGFGGALTESSAWVLAQLTPAQRREVLRRYFDPRTGIGYTLARTHINSCDFSLGEWALDPVAGDVALTHFSLAPMRRWVLPLLHEADRAAGAGRLRLLASPWSPPSWMKTNGSMTDGGQLRPEYADAWARYLARFLVAMRSEEHLPVWSLTVQNEPLAVQTWESCIFSSAEERDFIRDHLGPVLERMGLGGVKLWALDHNRDLLADWTHTIYSDPAAARYVYGTAVHWYGPADFAAESRAHAAAPGKPVLMTEGCCERSTDSGHWELGKWEHGERYAHSMVNDFRNWATGWIDWNIVLDQSGGPNHVGNFCDAPVIVHTETGAVDYTPAFYYIGQFSRFVAPGAVRIGSEAIAGAESVAFVNPDGSMVVVVLNTAATAASFDLAVQKQRMACRIPGHAIQTYVLTSR